jgi:sugar phosphate isomerase/epimerase
MNRRRFIGTLALGALAASVPVAGVGVEGKLKRIGLQLYSVRDRLQRDFEGTLAEVSAIGYTEVEFAGYFDRSPREIRGMLDRHGLTAPSAHIPYDALGAKWTGILEDCRKMGHEYVVCPSIDAAVVQEKGGWKRAAETFNRAAESARKAGIQFAFHNHVSEFTPVDGRLAYDLLLEETDPDLVKMEMDMCWIVVAGQDPQTYFDRWPGRFVMVHIKDLKTISKRTGYEPVDLDRLNPDMTTVGNGVIDWKHMLHLAEKAGVKHYFVENDALHSSGEFLSGSYKYLRDLRF